MLPTISFTLCFLLRGDRVLLLHRRRPPNQGLWNGVGGKIGADETPLAACLREVQEETGYRLGRARFGGALTWTGFEIADGGLYLYVAPAPPGEPHATPEGDLRWWPVSEASHHPQVVPNLHIVLPRLLASSPAQVYHMRYGPDGGLQGHEIRPWPAPDA